MTYDTASLLRLLRSGLPAPLKTWLKVSRSVWKRRFVEHFRAFGPTELQTCLRDLGIHPGDTVMLHSSFDATSGFRGSPKELIDAFLGVLGPSGNLLMVSLAYRTSTQEYLEAHPVFDVRRTSSKMGLVSETFRRRHGVLRSLHPTHPVLAYGPKAEWIVGDHERCACACGPGSPFDKLALLDGTVVFFNVPPTTMTFFHYLEHLVESELDFPLYADDLFDVRTVDWSGRETTVRARVFSRETVHRRRPMMLWAQLERRSLVRKAMIGNTRLVAVDVKHAIACTQEMAHAGALFYANGSA